MRRTPPPYYRVSVSGPKQTLPFRQRAADEYNNLRLQMNRSDRQLAALLEVDKGALGRWGRGTADVPYWVILRLRQLTAGEGAAE